MRLKYFYILLTLVSASITLYSQDQDVEKLMRKGEYSKAFLYIENMYHQDTLNKARLYDLYYYYKDGKNPSYDLVSALFYAELYNEAASAKDDKINLDELAQNTLSVLYKQQNIDALNRYITITDRFPALQQESKRIRDRLAFEKVQDSQSIEEYEKFLNLYPDAIQSDQARQWLNDHMIQSLLKSQDADKLRKFAQSTSNEDYRKLAMEEVDKLVFKEVLEENTVEAYERYIKEFPNGEYILMAKNKRDAAQYDKYVNEGTLTDMMYFLRTTDKKDKNYSLVAERLKLQANLHYSIPAMQLLDSLEKNDNDLKNFAKRYISDLSLSSVERITQAFPELSGKDYIVEAEKKATAINTLLKKKNLTLEDYKKNKALFGNLNAHQVALLFSRFYALNETQPKSKAINFNLNSDIHLNAFTQAKNMELNLVLTDEPSDINFSRQDMNISDLNIEADDIFISDDKKTILFSFSGYDGYDAYPSSSNKDIYYSVFKDGKWTKPLAMLPPVNTRFAESNPVLSKDKKMLFFSSDRNLNFGKADVYVAYREDTKDWTSWSEPILLGEDINTADNDYVVLVEDNLIVLSQDNNFDKENNIYLEGNTNLDIQSGRVKSSHNDYSNLKINLLSSKDYSHIKTILANDKGFFAFIKPKGEFLFQVQKNNFYAPLSQNKETELFYIDELAANSTLITLNTFFNPKNPIELTKYGQSELANLASSFKNKPFILTVEVHTNNGFKKMGIEELSQKQAEIIKDYLLKKGLSETNILVEGLGNEKFVQGWEGKDCIDIGVLSK
ncbi:MAG: OmpA family protein [Bacteroidales bacterium]|nr:OmpA family protein [Bacteroidales bacterium]